MTHNAVAGYNTGDFPQAAGGGGYNSSGVGMSISGYYDHWGYWVPYYYPCPAIPMPVVVPAPAVTIINYPDEGLKEEVRGLKEEIRKLRKEMKGIKTGG